MLVNIHFQKYDRKQYLRSILDKSGLSRSRRSNWLNARKKKKKMVCDIYINFGQSTLDNIVIRKQIIPIEMLTRCKVINCQKDFWCIDTWHQLSGILFKGRLLINC